MPVDIATWAWSVSIASGVLLAATAIVLAGVRPRRPYQLSFSLFLVAWSVLVVAGGLTELFHELGDPAAATLSMRIHVAALVGAFVPLVHFAALYPLDASRLSWRTGALVVVPAVAGAAILVFEPSLFHRGFEGAGGASGSPRGPLYAPYSALFFGAFLAAVVALHRHQRDEFNHVHRSRSLYVMAALGLFVAYESGENLVLFGAHLAAGAPGGGKALAATHALLSLAGLLVVGAVTTSVGRCRRLTIAERRALVAAAAIPAGAGLGAGALIVLGVELVSTMAALVRVAAVTLIVYGLLRFEHYDLEVRLQRAATLVAVGGSAIATAFLVERALRVALLTEGPRVVLAGLAGLALLVALVATLPMGGPWAVRRDPGREAWLHARKLEVYEAAVARHTRSTPAPWPRPDAELDALRRRLRISPAEDGLVRELVAGMAPSSDPGAAFVPGRTLAGRYRLQTVLAAGSTSRALLAHDAVLDRPVVVKLLGDRDDGRAPERVVRHFLREARLAAAIEHPNVIRVYDFGAEGGLPYLVAEHARGGTLQAFIDRVPDMPLATAGAVLVDALEGLAAIHDHGVIHRDIKPDNLLLAEGGVVKVGDFGIAMTEGRVDEVFEGPRRVGTPMTMSPEAVLGRDLTEASDLYSMGAVAYRLFTGELYLDLAGSAAADVEEAIVSRPPRTPDPPLPAPVQRFLDRALEKNPADRFPDARTMRAALVAALQGVRPELASGPTNPERPGGKERSLSGRGTRGASGPRR